MSDTYFYSQSNHGSVFIDDENALLYLKRKIKMSDLPTVYSGNYFFYNEPDGANCEVKAIDTNLEDEVIHAIGPFSYGEINNVLFARAMCFETSDGNRALIPIEYRGHCLIVHKIGMLDEQFRNLYVYEFYKRPCGGGGNFGLQVFDKNGNIIFNSNDTSSVMKYKELTNDGSKYAAVIGKRFSSGDVSTTFVWPFCYLTYNSSNNVRCVQDVSDNLFAYIGTPTQYSAITIDVSDL